MIRRQDWPLRLNAWLDSARQRPFVWGTHDCVMAAADAVKGMTDKDPAQAWRGQYATRTGAARVLLENGGLEGMVCEALGAPLENPRFAQRGDLVLVDTGAEGPAIAVVVGAEAAGPGLEGVVFAPMKDWRVAWRV